MRGIKALSLLIFFIMLQACANNTPQNTPLPNDTSSYSPVITNDSYLFRSPPPAAISAGIISRTR